MCQQCLETAKNLPPALLTTMQALQAEFAAITPKAREACDSAGVTPVLHFDESEEIPAERREHAEAVFKIVADATSLIFFISALAMQNYTDDSNEEHRGSYAAAEKIREQIMRAAYSGADFGMIKAYSDNHGAQSAPVQ